MSLKPQRPTANRVEEWIETRLTDAQMADWQRQILRKHFPDLDEPETTPDHQLGIVHTDRTEAQA